MKPHETSAKKRKLSEPALGVLVAIGAFFLWLLFHTFGPNLSEIVPLRITLLSAGRPVADATVLIYDLGDLNRTSVKTDENGQCSAKWNRDKNGEVSIKVTKSEQVLFDGVVPPPRHGKLRLAVDKNRSLRGLID